MGHQIIQQPDGKLCVFSTVVDALVIIDASAEELLDYYAGDAAAQARQRAQRVIDKVMSGNAKSAYYQFTLSYDEAVRIDQAREAGELA